MKLELKENMYIRTKDGYISQYKYYDTTNMGKLLCIPLNNKTFANIEDIVKASYNIIDILEKGDYVNGVEIIKIYEKGDSFEGNRNYIFKEKTIEVANDNYETIPFEALFINKEIETIVTHEQMEQMAYKVGE